MAVDNFKNLFSLLKEIISCAKPKTKTLTEVKHAKTVLL